MSKKPLSYPFEYFRKIWADIEEETRKKVGKKVFTWSEHISDWIDQWKELIEISTKKPNAKGKIILTEKDFQTHLFPRRATELFKNLLWIQNCVLSGAYHTAIHELRYLMEMMIQSYYLDTNYPEASIENKLWILKALEDFKPYPTGTTIIDRCNFGEKNKRKKDDLNKNELKDLYSKLSGYVHPSLTEMLSQYPYIGFNEELFDLCVEFSNDVMDTIYKLTEKWKEVMKLYF